MIYHLIPACVEDKTWLDQLRREVYQDLFQATFGGWDEIRHARQFDECWQRGGIFIIRSDGARVGMIQLFDRPDRVEIGEIQIQPSHQNRGIGTRILMDTIAHAHGERKKVSLSVGLKNVRAFRLYQRLGFRKVASNDTHNHLASDPQS